MPGSFALDAAYGETFMKSTRAANGSEDGVNLSIPAAEDEIGHVRPELDHLLVGRGPRGVHAAPIGLLDLPASSASP